MRCNELCRNYISPSHPPQPLTKKNSNINFYYLLFLDALNNRAFLSPFCFFLFYLSCVIIIVCFSFRLIAIELCLSFQVVPLCHVVFAYDVCLCTLCLDIFVRLCNNYQVGNFVFIGCSFTSWIFLFLILHFMTISVGLLVFLIFLCCCCCRCLYLPWISQLLCFKRVYFSIIFFFSFFNRTVKDKWHEKYDGIHTAAATKAFRLA